MRSYFVYLVEGGVILERNTHGTLVCILPGRLSHIGLVISAYSIVRFCSYAAPCTVVKVLSLLPVRLAPISLRLEGIYEVDGRRQ